MHEPLDPLTMLHNGIGDGLGTQHICFEEEFVVVNRARHMRLGGHMNNDIRLRNECVHEFAVANIAVPEFIASRPHRPVRAVLYVPSVSKGIYYKQPVVRIFLIKMSDKVAADK